MNEWMNVSSHHPLFWPMLQKVWDLDSFIAIPSLHRLNLDI